MDAHLDKQIIRSWQANADAWSRAVREHSIDHRRLTTDPAVLGAIYKRSPGCILDVGCGEGWLARACYEHGIQVVGIDASVALIEAARAAGGGDFRLLSFDELTANPALLGSHTFDVAVCNFALLHENVSGLLGALRDVLVPKGTLIIQTIHPWTARGSGPYTDGWREERFESFPGDFPEPMPWYFRTLTSWVAVLANAGFVVDELLEPRHADTDDPISLIIVARALDT